MGGAKRNEIHVPINTSLSMCTQIELYNNYGKQDMFEGKEVDIDDL